MKYIGIALLMIAVATIVLGTFTFIQNSDKSYEEGISLPFEDVPEDAWYFSYVAKAYDLNWIEGRTLITFEPDSALARGEFALMLYRYLGSPDVAGLPNPFTDLDNSRCKDAVVYLKKLGIIDGKTDTLFAPAEHLTREQLVTILHRLGGYEVHEELSPSGKFADRDTISSWALEAVDWAIHSGFLSGMTETTLCPQAPATRAQATKILCLYGEATGYKTETSSDRSVVLKVWQAGVDDSNAALSMKKLLNRFERRNPGISIEYVPIPSRDDPYDTIQKALKKGEGPDVILVSAPYEMLLADEGLIMPLDTLLTTSVTQDILPSLMIDCAYQRDANPELQGKLVSAPLFSTPRALLVNRKIYDHFGVDTPNSGFTYDTLLTNAQALTGAMDGKVIYGIGTRAGSPCLYLGMVWSAGGKIVDPATGLASTNNDLWKKTTESYLTLYSNSLTPDYSVSMDYNSQLGMFANGNVAMIDAALSSASLINKKSEWIDNLAIYPFMEDAQAAALCVGEVAVISHNTENIVDSAKLINYLMEPDSQIIYSRDVGYLPGVLSALEATKLKTDSYLAPYVVGVEDTAALGEDGYAVYCLIRDELKKVLRGELTVEDYCVGLEQQINTLLQTP